MIAWKMAAIGEKKADADRGVVGSSTNGHYLVAYITRVYSRGRFVSCYFAVRDKARKRFLVLLCRVI